MNQDLNPRRSDYDVTNTVQVSSTAAVKNAVFELLHSLWPGERFASLTRAFDDFDRMFNGRMPGYVGVDTAYHDRQHTLDITLAMARMIVGHERQAEPGQEFGVERATLGLITALFHDVGYLRTAADVNRVNGAEFTRLHVSRGAAFLGSYPAFGHDDLAARARHLVHYTGYEIAIADIPLADPLDRRLGCLLGTADLIAQMADRCYLEKCRDRLYLEFVIGGVALPLSGADNGQVKYASGIDLLRQTPDFVVEVRRKRLDGEFGAAYRYVEILFNGTNPYIEAIDRNIAFLQQVLRSENWKLLRRNPPVFAAVADPMAEMRGLMLGYLKKAWSR